MTRLLAGLVLLMSAAAEAQPNANRDYKALTGLSKIGIYVTNPEPQYEPDSTKVLDKLVARLWRAGILDEKSSSAEQKLSTGAELVCVPSGLVCDLRVTSPVVLPGASSRTRAVIWHQSSSYADMDAMMDLLISDYFKANPKKR